MDDNIFTNDEYFFHVTQDETIKTLFQRDHVRRCKLLDVKRMRLVTDTSRIVCREKLVKREVDTMTSREVIRDIQLCFLGEVK